MADASWLMQGGTPTEDTDARHLCRLTPCQNPSRNRRKGRGRGRKKRGVDAQDGGCAGVVVLVGKFQAMAFNVKANAGCGPGPETGSMGACCCARCPCCSSMMPVLLKHDALVAHKGNIVRTPFTPTGAASQKAWLSGTLSHTAGHRAAKGERLCVLVGLCVFLAN